VAPSEVLAGSPATPWRTEARALIALAAPLSLAFLAQMAISVTDVVMMGWLGPADLAAGSLASNYNGLFFFFGMGVGTATAPMIAHALGARRMGQIRPIVQCGLWLVLGLSLPFGLGIWWGADVLVLIGQDPSTAFKGEAYLRTAIWALPANLIFVVLRNFVAAHSRPRSALVVVVLAIAVNAAANYALMFGHWGAPRLELMGAGIATSIADWFMALALLAFVLVDRRFRRYRLWARAWPIDLSLLKEMLRIGVPIGFTVLAEMGMFMVTTFLAGLVDTMTLAAHAIAMQTSGIAFMVPFGLGQAASVRIGLAAGGGRLGDVRLAGWTAIAVGLATSLGAAVLIWFGAPLVVDGFLDLDDAATRPLVPLASSFLAVVAFMQIFDTNQSVAAGALRGLKDTRVPMIYATVGYWGVGLAVAVGLGFGLGWGGVGIWIGMAAGLAVVASLLTWRFARLDRWYAGS